MTALRIKTLVAVDVGGTFTDLILLDASTGEIRLAKAPSTPPNYYEGVLNALEQVVGADFSGVDLFVHGTTVHLNALLERKGVPTGIVATKGFGDIYAIGRGSRPRAYDLHFRNPRPIVERKDIFEVTGRLDASGDELEPLSHADLDAAAAAATAKGLSSLAICFLNSYRNKAHEAEATAYLRKTAPHLFVTPSTEICREWREFERTSTAVINAYISPILQNYLRNLRAALRDRGFRKQVFLMQSSGGLISAEEAETRGALTLFSGPVGGNVGSKALSRVTGRRNLICIDMGGTSFEVSIIANGEAIAASERVVAGFPVLAPMVDVLSIGAGGGSLAWNDAGALRVGPQSAGAQPGPVCYGAGGTQPTVTDANLLLGRLRKDKAFAGIALRYDLAANAIADFGGQLGLSQGKMAEGIVQVINARMANAIRTMTVQRGLDPRDFALVAFGGAGPMHAVEIGRELNIDTTIVPNCAGAFSAWGMLKTEIRQDLIETELTQLHRADPASLKDKISRMEAELVSRVTTDEVDADSVLLIHALDLRYKGQEYFLTVPFDPETIGTPGFATDLKAMFDAQYERTYGHKNLAEAVDLVNLRVTAVAPLYPGASETAPDRFIGEEDAGTPLTQLAYFGGEARETIFTRRAAIKEGVATPGPLVIEEASATTVVPPGYSVTADPWGNLIVTRDTGV